MKEKDVKELGPEFLRGTVKLVVLATLAGTPKHGYAVLKEIRALLGDVYEVREGTLYPTLHRLEGDGYLKSDWRVSTSGRHRRYYRLTPNGRQVLQIQKEVLARMFKTINTAGNK